MKNIHILPTDKLSRLYLFEERLILGDLVTVVFKNSGAVNQNIYITCDEEIKERDWCFDIFLQAIFQANRIMGVKTKNTSKKIILTTDQELIKDGVQAINDNFLEWFVKNPSCENVEVVKDRVFRLDEFNQREFYNQYKIIIPKEEVVDFLGRTTFDLLKQEAIEEEILEQETLDNIEIEEMSNDWETMSQQIKPKQETLEEACDRIFLYQSGDMTKKVAKSKALELAKWQQERNYEEVLSILYKHTEDLLAGKKITLEEWFEQFKKK